MKRAILAGLICAGSCYGGVLLAVQSDSCLGNQCTAAKSGTLQNGNDFNIFTESAASAFGILHVAASSSFSVTNSVALALGFVSFTEDLTITSPSHPNGSAGLLTVGYSVDGTTSASGGGHAFLQVIARDINITNPANPVLVVNYVRDFNASTNGSFVVSPLFPFTYGTKFELYISMQATAGSITDDLNHGYSLAPRTASGSGTSNFFNTLVLNELMTGDGQGNFVGDSSIVGDSNTPYTQGGVVPEPGTWMLVALALPVVLLRRRRN